MHLVNTQWPSKLSSWLVDFWFIVTSLWESVIVLCFVVRYFMSILVLQSSWWGRESWLLCLICLPGVSWRLSGSSSRCHRVVCSLWLWYFLIILTYYFSVKILVRLGECQGWFCQAMAHISKCCMCSGINWKQWCLCL